MSRAAAAAQALPVRETTTAVRRIAHKLGAREVLLLGTVTPSYIEGLSGLDLIGSDEPARIAYARARAPGGTWDDDPTSALKRVVASTLVLATPAELRRLTTDARDRLGSAAAVVIVGVDSSDSIESLEKSAAVLGLHVVRRELVAVEGSSSHRRNTPLVVASAEEQQIAQLVETSLHSLRLDAAVDSFAASNRRARVCIISYEVVGPVRNGGIGTANTSLALRLAERGHDVSLVLSGTPSEGADATDWKAWFGERGVRYTVLPDEPLSDGNPGVNVARAWAAYRWLRDAHAAEPFDVLHTPECQAHGYFIGLAKRLGVAFENLEIVVGVHSPTTWCFEANRAPMLGISNVIDDHLERSAVATADVVLSPSGYLVGYLRERGWSIPDRTFVEQYATSDGVRRLTSVARDGAPRPIDELVFFGRLEARKGLELFCDALDLVAGGADVPAITVTFLGSSVTVAGRPSVEYIDGRAARWPWPVRIETDLDQPEAVAYLVDGARLAVMPSLVDNSPNTVYEALALGIPLLVSRSGGTGELIAARDLDSHTFDPFPSEHGLEPCEAAVPPPPYDAAALAERLARTLREGHGGAEPSAARDDVDQVLIDWHAGPRAQPAADHGPLPELAVVSVGGHPTDELQQLHAGAVQVVSIVDAARDSTGEVVRSSSPTDGRALNAAALTATASLILWLDADVVPRPELAPALRRAAACAANFAAFLFVVEDADGVPSVPISGPAELGLTHLYTGTSGIAIRADAWREIGGFETGDLGDCWILGVVTRLHAAGHEVAVVPATLGALRRRPVAVGVVDDEAEHEPAPRLVAEDLTPEQQVAFTRPFLHTGLSLSHLPDLYRASGKIVVETAEHARRTYEWGKRTEKWAEETRQWASETNEWAQTTIALRERETLAARERADRAEATLAAIYASRSWRLIVAAQRVRAELAILARRR